MTNNKTKDANFYQLPLFLNSPKTKLYHPNPNNMPGRLRYGDIDKDGFPDLLLTVLEPGDVFGTSYIFLNKPCTDPDCTIPRTFILSDVQDMNVFK